MEHVGWRDSLSGIACRGAFLAVAHSSSQDSGHPFRRSSLVQDVLAGAFPGCEAAMLGSFAYATAGTDSDRSHFVACLRVGPSEAHHWEGSCGVVEAERVVLAAKLKG